MSVEVSGQRPLRGLAAKVSMTQLQSLLSARSPNLLTDPGRHELTVEIIRGVASEVTALVGSRFVDVAEDDALDLAVWAVTLGAAASVELSLFPTQQTGDDSRGAQLRVQYLGVRADLVASTSTGAVGGGTDGAFTIRARPPTPVLDAERGWG